MNDTGNGPKLVRETTEQWDDVPSKVVGRRSSKSRGWIDATLLQERANEGMAGRTSWPKGVVRFRSFEEADAWWIQQMKYRKS